MFRSEALKKQQTILKALPGDHSEREPPDPISNSEVKTLCADDSMGSPHVKVGHCQAFKHEENPSHLVGVFFCDLTKLYYTNRLKSPPVQMIFQI